ACVRARGGAGESPPGGRAASVSFCRGPSLTTPEHGLHLVEPLGELAVAELFGVRDALQGGLSRGWHGAGRPAHDANLRDACGPFRLSGTHSLKQLRGLLVASGS